MKTVQYTIRSIPPEIDRLVRKKARLTGKSINQVILDDMQSIYAPKTALTGALAGLDWFVGSGSLDDATLQALEEDDRIQKSLYARENKKIEDLFYDN
jgi:hypothetical protein